MSVETNIRSSQFWSCYSMNREIDSQQQQKKSRGELFRMRDACPRNFGSPWHSEAYALYLYLLFNKKRNHKEMNDNV